MPNSSGSLPSTTRVNGLGLQLVLVRLGQREGDGIGVGETLAAIEIDVRRGRPVAR